MNIAINISMRVLFFLSATIIFQILVIKACSADVLNSQVAITPQTMVTQMGAGIDVTWSEVNSKIDAYNSQATIDFANKGFKHFRLRVANDDVTTVTAFLDEQITDSLENGVIPIIANQSHSFEDNPTAETQAEWVKWWTDIADHYKDYPYELMFDLIVEIAASSPLSDEPIDQLNEAYEQVVTAIRNTGGNNGKRIIIFSAHKRSDPTKMSQLNIPSQGNGYLIGEFHEGYASGPSTDPTNPHYYWHGTDEEIRLMSDRADAALSWSNQTGIPVWEGAWMPGNYNKGDDYDVNRQIAFLTDFVGVLNERNIPHAVNATKKFYDVETNQWNHIETVVDAILALQPALNSAPNFSNEALVKPHAQEEQNYISSISTDAADVDGHNLIFAKLNGPAWLTIGENGELSGLPKKTDIGLNSFQVTVADEFGLTDNTLLKITVLAKKVIPDDDLPASSSTGGSLSVNFIFLILIKILRFNLFRCYINNIKNTFNNE